MSERIKRNLPLIRALAKARTLRERKLIMDTGGDDLVKSICECVTNVLRGNVRLKPKERRRLARYKRALRRIMNAKGIGAKRRHLVQKGGLAFLPALIGPLLGALIGSFGSSRS